MYAVVFRRFPSLARHQNGSQIDRWFDGVDNVLSVALHRPVLPCRLVLSVNLMYLSADASVLFYALDTDCEEIQKRDCRLNVLV
jgi:hypothetical protein